MTPNKADLNVLVVGATGSVGTLVVEEALRHGHAVRALVRDMDRARELPVEAQRVVGDLTRGQTLRAAVKGMDAIVFTHGSTGGGKVESERVDYGAVRNVLEALAGRQVRIALMTAIGVTDRNGRYNRATETHDWKRRGERLVRASGMPYTIVRPGWFDYNTQDQRRLVLLQGDTRHVGDPSDGVVARRQIAELLVHSLTSAPAERKTLELVAEHGPASTDLDALLSTLVSDAYGGIDGVRDATNMRLADEPPHVRKDLQQLAAQQRPSAVPQPRT